MSKLTVVFRAMCVHSEMRQLTVEVDRLAPLVIEAARFVATGDKSQTSSLRLLVDDWVNAVCRTCFFCNGVDFVEGGAFVRRILKCA